MLGEDYRNALACLGRALLAYAGQTRHPAVLVGGGAVQLYTGGGFASGDFDIIAMDDAALDACLAREGFIPEHRSGFLKVGYYHPDLPGYGVQQVAQLLFEGQADRHRLLRVDVGQDAALWLPAMEDMVVDRVSQFCAWAGNTDRSRLLQARLMLTLATRVDRAYLSRRLQQECGDSELIRDLLDSHSLPPPQQGPNQVTLEAMMAGLQQRYLELELPLPDNQALRNPGTRRTAVKQALLEALEERGRSPGTPRP